MNHTPLSSKTILSIVFLFTALLTNAQTIIWDGGAHDHKWSSPDNWDSNTVPTSTDEVLIDSDSVNVDVNVTVKSLELTSDDCARGNYGKLVIATGFKLTIDGSNSTWVAFTIESSSVRNDGELIVRNTTTAVSMETMSSPFARVPSVFVNKGELKIRNCTTSLNLWEVGEFYNEAIGNVQIEDGLVMGANSGECVFENEGTIDIRNTYLEKLGSSSQLLNRGTLNVKNSPQYGISTNGDFTNFGSGVVIIDSTEFEGFIVEGKFRNNGSIGISNHKLQGLLINILSNDSTLNKGNIIIENQRDYTGSLVSVEDGIEIMNGSLINDVSGFISLKKLNENALRCNDRLENKGEIIIDSTNKVGVYITSNGSFRNENGSSVNVSNTDEIGVEVRDSLQNAGLIRILSSGNEGVYLASSAYLENSGELLVSESAHAGMSTGSSSKLINTSDGLIKIDTSGGDGITMGADTFIENGVNATISINSTGEDGIYVRGKLSNIGLLKLMNVDDDGFNIRDTIHNFGSIEISQVNMRGLYSGVVLTEPLSSISINRSDKEGIFNSQFHNKGILTIDSSGTYGLNSPNTGRGGSDPIICINDGIMIISRCEIAGINTEGDFENNGIIFLDSTNSLGIANSYNFDNASKGFIALGSPWENTSNSLTPKINNSGFIFQDSELPNQEGMAPSFLSEVNNKGIYINSRSSPSLKNWTNDGLALWGIAGQMSTGAVETVAHKGGFPTNAPAATWYLDKNLTQAAGDYIYGNNIFIPNSQGVNADSLWFSIDINGNSTELYVLVDKTPECVNHHSLTFNEDLSQEWTNPFNWSVPQIPSPCSIAIIPNTKKCTLPSGYHARAYRLETDEGAVLNIEAGAVLDVTPN
ncbi:hypothetical protein [Jiulongibacter sp. NS-SX5]|uniref:hypothetical protein n=1 Tax=Jiulongibacter sp. NS-SX5 TaxID=3463854 RepID=UPI004059A0FB